jgi:hypothetical protein
MFYRAASASVTLFTLGLGYRATLVKRVKAGSFTVTERHIDGTVSCIAPATTVIVATEKKSENIVLYSCESSNL